VFEDQNINIKKIFYSDKTGDGLGTSSWVSEPQETEQVIVLHYQSIVHGLWKDVLGPSIQSVLWKATVSYKKI